MAPTSGVADAVAGALKVLAFPPARCHGALTATPIHFPMLRRLLTGCSCTPVASKAAGGASVTYGLDDYHVFK